MISPKETMKILVHERRGLGEALIIFFLFSILNWTALVLALKHLLNYLIGTLFTFMRLFTPWLLSLVMVLGLIFDVILWVLSSVGIHITLRAVNGGGSFEDTMSILGYSQVSRVPCIVPLALSPFMPITSMILYLVFSIVAIMWFVYLASLGLSEAHGVSFEKALIAVILPPLAVIGLLVIAPLLWGLIGFWRWIP